MSGSNATSLGSEISARFQLVNAVPAVTLVAFAFVVLALDPIFSHPSLDRLSAGVGSLDLAEGLGLGVITYLVALVGNSWQSRMTKLLEGYWKPVGVRSVILEFGLRRHAALRLLYLDRQSDHDTSSRWHRHVRTLALQVKRNDASARQLEAISERNLRRWFVDRYEAYPPIPDEAGESDLLLSDRLLPTRLGNTLRMYEDRAGNRYGLSAVLLIPHLFGIAKPDQLALLDDSRVTLDMSVKFVWTWLACTVLSLLAFADDGPWLVVPLVTYLLARASYSGAISAAGEYGRGLVRMMDLYRFELIEQMRWSLPERPGKPEQDSNKALVSILRGHAMTASAAKYVHTTTKQDAPDVDTATNRTGL